MSNVRPLRPVHPARSREVREFCAAQARYFKEQATSPEGAAAALSMVITANGEVCTQLAAVEPAHAAVLLHEIDRLRAQLFAFVAQAEPQLLQAIAPATAATNVLPLARRAA